MDNKTVIIDADSIPFIAARHGKQSVDWIVNKILKDTNADEYVLVVSSVRNMRKEINPDYKNNRSGLNRHEIEGYDECVEYMIEKYSPLVIDGYEADDICSVLHQRIAGSVLAGIDKDLLQSTGHHYNYRIFTHQFVPVEGEIYTLNNKIHTTGIYKIYAQMLQGDQSDNIVGIRGIGPVKAFNLLKDCKNEEELIKVVWKEYLLAHGNTLSAKKEFEKNFRMVFLPRTLSHLDGILGNIVFRKNAKKDEDEDVQLSIQAIY